jgi:hypothetical protein
LGGDAAGINEMNSRTKTGLEILQVAVVLGVLGDVLLRQVPWGLNVLLFNLAFAGGLLMLLRRHAPERLTLQTYSLLGALVFFASMFVWRDSIELRVADTFAIITILGVLFLPTLKITARIAGVFQYAIGVLWAGINSVFSPVVLLASDISWNEMQANGWRKHTMAIIRGVLIATPLILVFGALFMAADAMYEGWIKSVLNIDFEKFISHGLLFGFFSWMTAGYFRGIVFGGLRDEQAETRPIGRVSDPQLRITPEDDASPMSKVRADSGEHPVTLPNDATILEHINISDPPNDESTVGSTQAETRPVGSVPFDGKESRSAGSEFKGTSSKTDWSWAQLDNSLVPGFTLGAVEIGVILGLVNLLFLSFVIFQIPYLFGGFELVQNTPDFKLAEYARRGFGELVAVAAIVLPMLLASHWLLKKESPAAQKLFRILAGIQIALLFVIMASAVQRLVILTGPLGYGMTTVRLYPMIFMTWLAIVFVLFACTVLRNARQYFAWAALWSAIVVLGATHVLNPDAFIVRTNIALMQQGREFDAHYNSQLSDDAVPSLLGSFESLNSEDQQIVVRRLAGRFCDRSGSGDLRSWNLARFRAFSELNSTIGASGFPVCENVQFWSPARRSLEDSD